MMLNTFYFEALLSDQHVARAHRLFSQYSNKNIFLQTVQLNEYTQLSKACESRVHTSPQEPKQRRRLPQELLLRFQSDAVCSFHTGPWWPEVITWYREQECFFFPIANCVGAKCLTVFLTVTDSFAWLWYVVLCFQGGFCHSNTPALAAPHQLDLPPHLPCINLVSPYPPPHQTPHTPHSLLLVLWCPWLLLSPPLSLHLMHSSI